VDVAIRPFRLANITLYDPLRRELANPLNEVSPVVFVKMTS
jgi:hypothetical protein